MRSMCHKQIVSLVSILMSSVRADMWAMRSPVHWTTPACGSRNHILHLSPVIGLRHLRRHPRGALALRPAIQISRAGHKASLSRRRPRIKNVAFGLSARRAPAENSQTKLIKGQGPASLNKIADQGISRRAGKVQSSVRTKSAHATYKSLGVAIW